MAAADVSGTAEEHPGTAGLAAVATRVTKGSEGNAVFPVAAVGAAGWLLLFILLLVVPPSSGPRRGGLERGTAPAPPSGGDEAPAVISLLTGNLDKLGFGVTLIDLAARGWFGVNGPTGQAGAWGTAGTGHVRGARRDAGRDRGNYKLPDDAVSGRSPPTGSRARAGWCCPANTAARRGSGTCSTGSG